MDPDRLKKLFLARHTIVRIVTGEEAEVVELALAVASSLRLEAWSWSVTDGVRRLEGPEDQPVPNTSNPAQGLRWLTQSLQRPSMVITLDLADQLGDSVNLRAFRDLAERVRGGALGRSAITMIDHTDRIPGVVGALSARYEVAAPDDEEIGQLIKATLRQMGRERKFDVRVTGSDQDFLVAMVQNLRGLTRRQVRQLVAETVADDHALTDEDLLRVQRGKRLMLQEAGVLEFVDAPTSMDEIGGLTRLKHWLKVREASFSPDAAKAGLAPPRGVLMLGVQGAGKSLAAKAIATAWRRPLMRLDPGSLFDKFIGETERKLREALRQAEAMSPVILWIDEIEKGFASSASESADGGVGRRMFGTLLTWMQEHRHPVFLVATANDIKALPPELLRKGRFDEIFFVDLPTRDARRGIFRIHLSKRKQDVSRFDLDRLADATEGYSGAEIEAAVLSALHGSFSSKVELTTEAVELSARASPPLSVTARERLEWLREWSRGRCVPAD